MAMVRDLGYTYGHFGNLTAWEDFLLDVYESFSYDRLHRLITVDMHAEADDRKLVMKTQAHGAAENIGNKVIWIAGGLIREETTIDWSFGSTILRPVDIRGCSKMVYQTLGESI